MRIMCKYCGRLHSNRKDVCSSCGAHDWIDETKLYGPLKFYSAEFIEQLCAMASMTMLDGSELLLSGLYSERFLTLPEYVYVEEDCECVREWINNWLTGIMLERKPVVYNEMPDTGRDRMVSLTKPTVKELDRIYKNMSCKLFREICLGLLKADTEVKAIYINYPCHFHIGNDAAYNFICPTHIWVDGYTKEVCNIIESAVEHIGRNYNVPSSCVGVEDYRLLIDPVNGRGQITKFTWEEMMLAASLIDIDTLNKYTTKFVKDTIYDYTDMQLKSEGIYVRHVGTRYWLLLKEGCQLENFMGTVTDEFDMSKIVICPNSSLRCISEDPLKFAASYEMKPKSGLSALLGAASKIFG